MSPVDHYAEAERLVERYRVSFREHDFPERVELLTEAQVHATLATVDPAFLRQAGGIQFFSQHSECTCPTLSSSPIARTSVDPGCPVHGVEKQ